MSLVLVSTVFALAVGAAHAVQGGDMSGAKGGAAGGARPATGGEKSPVTPAGGAAKPAGGVKPVGGVKPADGGVKPGDMGDRGVTDRGIVDQGRGVDQGGMVDRGTGQRGFEGRSFDRQSFFGGKDHQWWRQNKEHHYWNGKAWVFGVEPVGFVAVPLPVSSCPYSPERFAGNANACFFSCVDGGYDPVGVCNVCCGTNY